MFNPEKQARGANGKFGGKAVAEVEAVAKEVAQVVPATIKGINEAINTKHGQIHIIHDPFDYPAGVTNKRTGWLILAAVLIALVIAYNVF